MANWQGSQKTAARNHTIIFFVTQTRGADSQTLARQLLFPIETLY